MKKFLSILCLAFCMSFITMHAEAKEFGTGVTTELEKTWTVTFSQPVNPATAADAVHVVEETTGKEIDVMITVNDHQVKVQPKNPYVNRKNYILTIDETIQTTSGKSLREPVTFPFKVQVKQSYEESFEATYQVGPETNDRSIEVDSDAIVLVKDPAGNFEFQNRNSCDHSTNICFYHINEGYTAYLAYDRVPQTVLYGRDDQYKQISKAPMKRLVYEAGEVQAFKAPDTIKQSVFIEKGQDYTFWSDETGTFYDMHESEKEMISSFSGEESAHFAAPVGGRARIVITAGIEFWKPMNGLYEEVVIPTGKSLSMTTDKLSQHNYFSNVQGLDSVSYRDGNQVIQYDTNAEGLYIGPNRETIITNPTNGPVTINIWPNTTYHFTDEQALQRLEVHGNATVTMYKYGDNDLHIYPITDSPYTMDMVYYADEEMKNVVSQRQEENVYFSNYSKERAVQIFITTSGSLTFEVPSRAYTVDKVESADRMQTVVIGQHETFRFTGKTRFQLGAKAENFDYDLVEYGIMTNLVGDTGYLNSTIRHETKTLPNFTHVQDPDRTEPLSVVITNHHPEPLSITFSTKDVVMAAKQEEPAYYEANMQQGDALTITNNLNYPLPFSATPVKNVSSTLFFYEPDKKQTNYYRAVFQDPKAVLEVPVDSTKSYKVDVYEVFDQEPPVTTFFIPYDYAKEVTLEKAE